MTSADFRISRIEFSQPTSQGGIRGYREPYALYFGREVISVTGDPGTLSTTEIVSHDRFIEYDERDLKWAVPLGLCSVERRLIRVGDRCKLSQFRHQNYRGYEADLVCSDIVAINSPSPLMFKAEFEIIGQITSPSGLRNL